MHFRRALFSCQERIKKMSMIDTQMIKKTAFAKPYTSAIGKPEPIAHPRNCRNECPYGRGRAFCFPCYAKIMGLTKEDGGGIAKEAEA